ncbi:MAG: nucleotidyltransferase family protein [Terriglobia bacterium]
MIPIAGVVLAAGESQRMGRDKPLLTYQQRPFLEAILEKLAAAGITERIVVLGYHADKIRAAVRMQGAKIIDNPHYRLGQTSSLQAGLREIGTGTAAGVLLCLVDHPAVEPRVISELVAAFERTGAPLIVPVSEGRRGHPVLIARALFAELLALTPDCGANVVLAKYRDAACEVTVQDRGILLDIDTPEDYRALAEQDRSPY